MAAVDQFGCDVGADVLEQPGRYALAAEAERQAANARAAAQTATRPNVRQQRERFMSRLEQRYRLVLRVLLPAAYRKAWEEDMVATFLDSVDSDDAEAAEYAADYGRPSWSEVASVASLAVRLRLGTAAGASPRCVAWGQAVRLVALMGLLVSAAAATIEAGSTLWLAGRLGWLSAPPADWTPGMPPSAWHTVWSLAGLLWLPAYVGLLLGHRRAAQLLAVLAVMPAGAAAISATVDLDAGAAPLLLTIWAHALVDALLVLALVAFHQDAPPMRRRPWLVALVVGIAVLLGLFLLVRPTNPWVLVDWPGMYCVVLVGVAVAHLAAPALGRTLRTPSWSLALVLLGLAVFGLRVVSLLDYALVTAGGQRSALLAVGAGEALAVLAVGGLLARRAAKLLRRLPPVPVAPTASSPPTW